MSLNLVQEFREAILTFPNCDCSTIGKLTALVKKYEDKRVIIAEPGEVVLRLPKKGGKEWLKALSTEDSIAAIHGVQCSQEASSYGQNLTDQLRQQLEDGK